MTTIDDYCGCGHSWRRHTQTGCLEMELVSSLQAEYCGCKLEPPRPRGFTDSLRIARITREACVQAMRDWAKMQVVVATEKRKDGAFYSAECHDMEASVVNRYIHAVECIDLEALVKKGK